MITDYRKAIVSSDRKIGVLVARLGDIGDRLGAINIDGAQALITTKEGTLKTLETECADDKVAYETSKKKRENERAILEELIKHFKGSVVGTTTNVSDAAYADNLTNDDGHFPMGGKI